MAAVSYLEATGLAERLDPWLVAGRDAAFGAGKTLFALASAAVSAHHVLDILPATKPPEHLGGRAAVLLGGSILMGGAGFGLEAARFALGTRPR